MPPKKEDNLCGKCTKSVRSEGIQCDVCDVWWHPVCARIESDLCECLRKNQKEALSSQMDKALTEVNKSMINRLKDDEIRNLIHDEMKKF